MLDPQTDPVYYYRVETHKVVSYWSGFCVLENQILLALNSRLPD
jgi:hypothetical protein